MENFSTLFQNTQSASSNSNTEQVIQKHKIACINCTRLHHKCDKNFPSCDHCTKRGIQCLVNSTNKKRGRPFGTTKENLLQKKEMTKKLKVEKKTKKVQTSKKEVTPKVVPTKVTPKVESQDSKLVINKKMLENKILSNKFNVNPMLQNPIVQNVEQKIPIIGQKDITFIPHVEAPKIKLEQKIPIIGKTDSKEEIFSPSTDFDECDFLKAPIDIIWDYNNESDSYNLFQSDLFKLEQTKVEAEAPSKDNDFNFHFNYYLLDPENSNSSFYPIDFQMENNSSAIF